MTIIAGLTHPGTRPGENEDSIGWDEASSLALVADGLGGHANGQVASALVKDIVLKLAGTLDLRAAVVRAHAAVIEAARQSEQFRDMASTIVAVQIVRRVAQIVWAGDSRAYLWRGGRINRLTRDDTIVEELRTSAGLTETQVRTHSQRSVVTNALGAGDPAPNCSDVPLRRGDWILLCSDGLSGELRDEEIGSTLARAASPGEAASALIAAALNHGGHDNVSAVLLKYDGASKRNFALSLSDGAIAALAVLGGVVLALIVGALLFWMRAKS